MRKLCWIAALLALLALPIIGMAEVADPIEPEIPPVYAHQLAEGTYAIQVRSSSSMFRVVDAQLTVAEGEMTCVLTMSGKGYGMLYMGTGEEALLDLEEMFIASVITEEGAVTFEVPVEALDMDIDCAAWSIRKERWYDRVLVFESIDIPAEAWLPAEE
ncbi:MAG: hypothetical protein ACOYI5_09340 [Christensenellales bacterium]|jgi:hypothetical protein